MKSYAQNVTLYYPYFGSTSTLLYFDLYLNTTYAATFILLGFLLDVWKALLQHSKFEINFCNH